MLLTLLQNLYLKKNKAFAPHWGKTPFSAGKFTQDHRTTRPPVKGSEANSADSDLTPHDVASDQSLQCLLTGFSTKNRIKATK